MDDFEINFAKLGAVKPEVKSILQLLVKKYNASSDDDVLQDGVLVSFDEMAREANIDKEKLPDEVFKDLDAPKNEYSEERRSYVPLVSSCLADEKDQEFRIIVNPHLFRML